jgi:hypothetical protein
MIGALHHQDVGRALSLQNPGQASNGDRMVLPCTRSGKRSRANHGLWLTGL